MGGRKKVERWDKEEGGNYKCVEGRGRREGKGREEREKGGEWREKEV